MIAERHDAPAINSNRAQFVEEMRSHFNEPILVGDRLARLIAFGEDEQDYYLVCVYMGGKCIWHTAVGGYTFLGRLKGQGHVLSTSGEEWDDLTRLDKMLALNGAPKADVFQELKATTSCDTKSPTYMLPIRNVWERPSSPLIGLPHHKADVPEGNDR